MIDKIFIVGAGRHAEEVKNYLLEQENFLFEGNIVDDSFVNIQEESCLSFSQFIKNNSSKDIKLITAIGSTERYTIIEKLEDKGFSFINLVHAHSYVCNNLVIGRGNLIAPMCVINTSVSIGNHCIINSLCNISHDCTLGNYVTLSPNVTLAGKVLVEDNVFIGAGATIMPNVILGKNSIIGAGACVTKNVPSNSTVVGVPAKIVSK